MRKRIVLIGAGSAVFTQGLVADFIDATDLGPLEICLVDIDSRALSAIYAVVGQMVQMRGHDIFVRASEDRRDFLRGADVVVTTVAVGGRRAWEQDVYIPRRYGVWQPVGDTAMPGGISRAMRMIPVMLEIAKDVASLCPFAYFFNYSNPMTAICTALRGAAHSSVIGLCHGVAHVERYLAAFIGRDPAEIRSLGAGLNHLTFLHDVRVGGESIWPLVKERRGAGSRGDMPDNPFSWEIFDRCGAFPAVLDRHVVEFFPDRFRSGAYYGRVLGETAFSIAAVIRDGDLEFQEMLETADGKREVSGELFTRQPGEHEQLVDILRSLYRDERRVFYVNMPQGSCVPGVRDAVLELPAAATGAGLSPLHLNGFPKVAAAMLNRRLPVIDLTVEAALTGDRRLFEEAILLDGSITDPDVAHQMAGDLLSVHRDHLPQFA